MPVIWKVVSHNTRGANRSVSIKRIVDGNESTAQFFSHNFHFKDLKLQIKAKFKEMYLAEKSKRVELRAFIKDSDLVDFETEVNS